MANDFQHILNELTLGSVPTASPAYLDPTQLQQPTSGQQAPQSVMPFSPGNPQFQQQMPQQSQRPTFLSAFLANLGPSLANGIAAGAQQHTLGAGIAAGVGGGFGGQIEQQRYQQQIGLQQQTQQRLQQQETSEEQPVAFQDAQGITHIVPARHVPTIMAAGLRAGAQEEVQGQKSATSEKNVAAQTGTMLDIAKLRAAENERVGMARIQSEQQLRQAQMDYTNTYRNASLGMQQDRLRLMAEGPSAASKSRADAAKAGNLMIDRVTKMLDDPALAAQLGPLPGTVSEFEKKLGAATPEVQALYGNLKSIYSMAGTSHGWRSIQVGQEFEKAYGGLRTNPAALRAGLEALHDSNDSIMQSIGRNPDFQSFNLGGGGNQNATKPAGDQRRHIKF